MNKVAQPKAPGTKMYLGMARSLQLCTNAIAAVYHSTSGIHRGSPRTDAPNARVATEDHISPES